MSGGRQVKWTQDKGFFLASLFPSHARLNYPILFCFYPFMFTTILFFSFLFYIAYIMSCLLFFLCLYVFKSGHSMLPDSMPHFLKKKTFWQNNKLDKDFFLTSAVVPYGRLLNYKQVNYYFCFNLNPIPSKVNRSVRSEGLNEWNGVMKWWSYSPRRDQRLEAQKSMSLVHQFQLSRTYRVDHWSLCPSHSQCSFIFLSCCLSSCRGKKTKSCELNTVYCEQVY